MPDARDHVPGNLFVEQGIESREADDAEHQRRKKNYAWQNDRTVYSPGRSPRALPALRFHVRRLACEFKIYNNCRIRLGAAACFFATRPIRLRIPTRSSGRRTWSRIM